MTTPKPGFFNRLSINHLWLIIPPLTFFILLCRTPLHEGDLWWHIKIGELIAKTRTLPKTDSFTFSADGLPFFFGRSWLADVIFYGLAQAGGLPALALSQAMVGAALMALILGGALQRGASPWLAGSAALLGIVGFIAFSSTRPQIIAFLCFGIYFKILSDWRMGRARRLWLLPVVMVLWANSHPTWVIGILLLAIFSALALIQTILTRARLSANRPLLLWGAASLAVILINPEGLGIWRDPLGASTNPVIQNFVSEWQPVSITSPISWFFFALVGIWISLLAFSREKINIYDFGVMLVLAAFSLRYMRMLPFFYLVALPVLAGLAQGLPLDKIARWRKSQPTPGDREKTGLPILNTLILFILIIAVLINLPQVWPALSGGAETQLVSDYFPKGAADFLEEQDIQPANLFSLPEWGGYLIWRHYPQYRVFADGRVELLPVQAWRDYVAIASASPGWQELLSSYGADFLLLSRDRHVPLIQAVDQAGFDCPYEDEQAVVCMMPGEGE